MISKAATHTWFIEMPCGVPCGVIKRQRAGIPMGDPLSPAMAIGACAWMEHESMQSIAPADNFLLPLFHERYFDGLCRHPQSVGFDTVVADFAASQCYQAP